jgi:hypothetical protein
MPQIDLRFGIPLSLVIVAVAAAIGLAFFFYRRTVPPVPRSKRILLSVLRTLALVLLVLLIGEPFLQILFTSSAPPALTILVDNSRSMSIAGHGGSRADIARSLLRSSTIEALQSRATIHIVPFGSSTHLTSPGTVDSLAFNDDGTDIAGALSTVKSNDNTLHSGAVLLLTDGIITLGENPLSLASSYPVPITTVAIGDSNEHADISVQRVAANAVVYSGTSTPVQVFVHATGFQDQRVDVTLADGTKAVGQASVVLEPGSHDYAVPFSWTPSGDGMHTLSASVGALSGELTLRNNRRAISVRVRKSKLNVLIISGTPSHDLTFLRSAIEEDRNLNVSAFTQTPTGTFFEGALPNALLDSVNCLVLIGMPTAATATRTIEAIASAVNRRQIPFLWIGGRNVDFRQAGALTALLPFTASNVSSVEQEVGLEPIQTEAGMALLAPLEPGQSSPWQQLPPVFSTRTLYAAKPGIRTLATARFQSVNTPFPILLAQDQPHRRSLAFLCHGLWRWRLLAQRSPAVADFFPHFAGNLIRWLTSPDVTAPLVVKPLAALYGQGEPLAFEAQVYDAQQRPIENALVHVAVRQRDQTTEGTLIPVGNGRYEGTLSGLSEEGAYKYVARATRDGVSLGVDSGAVRVGDAHVEFLSTQTQTALLRSIAARSGGGYIEPGRFDRLPEELERQGFFAPRTTTRGVEIQLRSWPYFLASIVLLLAIEWFIRKRSGMI